MSSSDWLVVLIARRLVWASTEDEFPQQIEAALIYWNVEDLLAERGLDLSYETVRRCVKKFDVLFAREFRRCRSRSSGRRHLDEVFVSIGGKRIWTFSANLRESSLGQRTNPLAREGANFEFCALLATLVIV